MGVENALVEIAKSMGHDSIITESDVLESYAGDASEVTPVVPDAVIRVQSTKEVSCVLEAASRHEIPVTPRAAGTGRVGGAVPVDKGIVISFEGLAQLKGIEKENLIAVAEPGLVTRQFHQAVEAEQLFFPPDPNSLDTCTVGGNIACNAGGPRAFKYGVTQHYVLGMKVVTADGTVLQLGKQTTKGVTGYDLTSLMVGSEGTLGVVTEATLKLIPNPEHVVTLLAFLPNIPAIQACITRALQSGIVARCLEFVDSIALDIIQEQAGLQVPKGARSMLLIELDGPQSLTEAHLEILGNILMEAGSLDVLVAQHGGERERLWASRRELSWSIRKKANFKLAEDIVVPRTRIGDLLDVCKTISEQQNICMPTYGHAGDGNLHVNFLWNHEGEYPRVVKAIEALFQATIAMNGTLSGEHGIGVLKAPYLGLEQSKELIAVQENIKSVFDPKGILNPGKLFPSAVRKFHGPC